MGSAQDPMAQEVPEHHPCLGRTPSVRRGHSLDAVGAGVAETAAGLEVALAVDAVAADEGAVLPVCPIAALGFTPGEG